MPTINPAPVATDHVYLITVRYGGGTATKRVEAGSMSDAFKMAMEIAATKRFVFAVEATYMGGFTSEGAPA